MQLAHLLTSDQILPAMESADHWPAIVELVDHLHRRDLLFPESRESVLEALKTREEFTSTGIGSGVAIPHAFSEKLDRIIAVFGRSAQGINFDAVDSHPVHFVILFLVPRQDYQLHLQALAAIARMFTNARVREELAAAPDAASILAILSQRTGRS
jgi:mannitol/fructose-specific phosphotransferase system IIA component (Ntr-type)